ncbi:GNAT family N-acetyltransferase [Pseudomonas sp. B24_DOA]|jgi:GNAT superfamily N-acetyltransferase|uniref:GNAT family N-acetyltransferase n=1 Tax=Pseudomonas TaxID=286 RepID=UPI00068AF0CF|nr:MULTISPECIES: GNAT family N-acetyltransferase [Pseudomonas]WKV82742.1 GNAT family N-acetyltransferase [Pseudomonas sp. B24_DOA]WKV88321.1 GNAT family N-acetyltransferase [Pseudomonas sp. B21_DOA]MCW0922584.1 GNAT family N-acetyltransferase [Pseudomonas sp. RG1]MDR7054747.1 GNAT superfamily N-acetyltransferase [Pseudomonas koreensis]PYC00816.1 GNAT family N-acetyltransferase [Pseudomonas koreensis]
MEAPVCIRPATLADTGIINRIVERSIRIGCALDHRNHPLLVSDWLNRSPADFISSRLADPHFYLCVALLEDKPVGVGMARVSGEILLCYVQPESFRRGVGRALMHNLEGWLRIRGVQHVHLNSTRTAEAFYRHLGYQQAAPPGHSIGLQTVPLRKPLSSPAEQLDQGCKSAPR